MERNGNKGGAGDDALIADIAYALWRSPFRGRLKTLEDCRIAARGVVRHIRRCRYRIEAGAALAPHAGVNGAPAAPAREASPPPAPDGKTGAPGPHEET